jgi:hypothetical protein
MPDHVHVILSLLETKGLDDRALARILKAIKVSPLETSTCY